MFGHIFINPKSASSLNEFAHQLFGRLGVTKFEERESSNFVEGHYFCGVGVGIKVRVAFADEQGLQDYRFWVSIEPEPSGVQDGNYLHQHAHTLALLFSQQGWCCFVPDDFAAVSGAHDGTVYAA